MTVKTLELLDKLQEELETVLSKDRAQRVKSLIAEISQSVAEETLKLKLPEEGEKIKEKLSKELATKEDIETLKVEIEALKNDFTNLRMELKTLREEVKADFERIRAEVERGKTEMLKWIIGLFLAQTTFITGLTLAIIKFFFVH